MLKSNITFDDFLKLDIRVGEVQKCEKIEKSNKLIMLEVDFGKEIGLKKILAGLAKYYQLTDFEGKKFLFLVNLPPKKILDEESQGMMLVTNVDDKPTMFTVDQTLPNGSFLY